MKTFTPVTQTKLIIQALALFILFLCSGETKAQCNNAPTLKFHSPLLLSGTDKEAGAIYMFPNVIPGVDAHVEIMGLYGGATLYNIDDSTGIGYYDAFQPYVGAAANDTSYIDWKISFKYAGTNTDTILACIAVTGVDIDGDAVALKEFIEAATPGSISVDPYTSLEVSFDGVRSKAISTTVNEPLIDTARLKNMFQMNFTNISALLYRNGAVTTGGAQVRQTCIYFKPFFQNYTMLLPVRLLSFTARSLETSVELNWAATGEESTKEYIVQKSVDGVTWKDIKIVAKGNESSINKYFINDYDKRSSVTYYRLKQADIKGSVTYSRVIRVSDATTGVNKNFLHNTLFTNTLNLQVSAQDSQDYIFEIYNLQGARIKRQQQKMYSGVNSLTISMPAELSKGVYVILTRNAAGRQLYSSKIVKG